MAIVSGGSDNLVKVWDGNTYELVVSLFGHAELSIMWPLISGSCIASASASDDGTIRIWYVDAWSRVLYPCKVQ